MTTAMLPLGLKITYTAVGSAIFWGRWGYKRLRPFVLADLIALLPGSHMQKTALEFLIFVALGCFVGIGIVDPQTPAQAISAGFGWTGLFGKIDGGTERGRKKIQKGS